MDAAARVLLLGIDAASPALLERWSASGAMPNLQALTRRSLVAPIRGLDGFFVGSTWPSLVTGSSPASHGVHYLAQVPSGGTAYRPVVEGAYVKRDPFWRCLSEAGRRVAILDVPLSRLTPDINGIQTVEWGSHDAVFGLHTVPATLELEIRDAVGPHPMTGGCDGIRHTAADYRSLVDRLVTGAHAKGRLTRELLGRGGWDLLVQVFTEAHCAGHQCWHLHDPTHPGHDLEVARGLGDPLRTVYAAVDDAVGEVIETAGDALVIVFTAHGMSFAHGAQLLLQDVLDRLGVTAPATTGTARPTARVLEAARAAARRLPPRARRPLEAIRRAHAADPDPQRLPSIGADLTRSLCYSVANGLAVGAIRLNLVGREPTGQLEPGDTQAFVERLSRELLAIVDDRTGRPAVRRIMLTRDLYRGEHVDDLPDLLVEWSDDTAIGSTTVGNGSGSRVQLSSPAIGVVERQNGWSRSGEHRRDGLLIAAGPGIPARRFDEPIGLLDIAPTLTRLLGVEMSGVEGSPDPRLPRLPEVG